MKNGPPCGPNTVVFTNSPLYGPRVGRTVDTLEHSSLDPKTSVLVKVLNDTNVMSLLYKPNGDGGSHLGAGGSAGLPKGSSYSFGLNREYDGLEVWKLSDVVFLDDCPSILGRVVTIDMHQVIVDVSYSQHQGLAAGLGASSSDGAAGVPAKSSLKVFRVTELELCVDTCARGGGGGGVAETGDLRTKSTRGKKTAPPIPSSSLASKQALLMSGITHHIAGIVQHKPVCLLDPCPDAMPPPSSLLDPEDVPQSPRIYGFKPLAVHVTDEGPQLLIERISDRKSFLLCSAHATSGVFMSTSFIAVGRGGGGVGDKASRCTVAEESVDAIESGLAVDQSLDVDLLFTSKRSHTGDPDPKDQTGTPDADNPSDPRRPIPQIGQKRRNEASSESARSSDADRSKNDPSTLVSRLASSHPSFISCYSSRVFFLQDTNGTVWPLANGLRLKPNPSSKPQSGKGRRTGGRPRGLGGSLGMRGGRRGGRREKRKQRVVVQPQQTYSSIVLRQHAIGKGNSVMVIVVGKECFLLFFFLSRGRGDGEHQHWFAYLLVPWVPSGGGDPGSPGRVPRGQGVGALNCICPRGWRVDLQSTSVSVCVGTGRTEAGETRG